MGRVPLRPLGLARRARLVLGAGLSLGAGLGRLAARERLRLLGAFGPARLRLRPALAWMGSGAARALHASRPALGRAARAGLRRRALGAERARLLVVPRARSHRPRRRWRTPRLRPAALTGLAVRKTSGPTHSTDFNSASMGAPANPAQESAAAPKIFGEMKRRSSSQRPARRNCPCTFAPPSTSTLVRPRRARSR